jgi:hypothetical protein
LQELPSKVYIDSQEALDELQEKFLRSANITGAFSIERKT